MKWFRKSLSLLSLIILLIMSGACSKPRITLEFELPSALHSTYTISYLAASSTQSRWIETAAMVQQGKGKLTLPLDNPAVLTLTGAGIAIHIYAERGDKIIIKGDSGDPFSWNIGGDKINEEWSNWRKKNSSALSSYNVGKINQAVEQYVKENPSNPLSALLLLYEFNRREDNDKFLSLWKSLKGEAAKEKWISISGRADLLTGHPVEKADLKKAHTLYLRSLENGADTIITGKVPVALLFWRNSDKERSKMIDSLRNLRKQHPDSASYIIADICFDPDSISWVSPLSSDSLRHIIRAWNPIAEADSAIRALGIENTPTLIIIPPVKR